MTHLASLVAAIRPASGDVFPPTPLNSGGTVDDHMQNVFFWIFWVSVVVGVLVAGGILYACFRFRRQSDDEVPKQIHGNNRLEVAWTLTPFVILVSLFVLSSVNMAYVNTAPASENGHPTMNVTVVGQQFTWTYDYSGLQDQSGHDVRTFEQLYVPADTAVNLDIVSSDPIPNGAKQSSCPSDPSQAAKVRGCGGNNECSITPFGTDPASIDLGQRMAQQHESLAEAISAQGCGVDHSFYIPSLAGQINAIPGQVNHLWFDARLVDNQETHYWGQCTELCGTGHATMLIEIVVLPREEWLTCSGQQFSKSCLANYGKPAATPSAAPTSAAASPSPSPSGSPTPGPTSTASGGATANPTTSSPSPSA